MAGDHHLATAERLASRLSALAAEAAEAEAHRSEEAWNAEGEGSWTLDKLDHWADGWPGLAPMVDTVNALDKALKAADFNLAPPPVGPWDFFGLGVVTLYDTPHEIHRGFVQPVVCLPVVTRMPDRVIAFLTRIPGGDDWLKGENHSNLGYHYHYLNAKKERSDVAICWDIRAHPQTPHPLFQEKHGESGSKFQGRPDLWGKTKRQSTHDACAKDLKRWTLDKFRMACDEAGPVWPLGAILTARPTQKPVAPRFPSKKGKTKGR